MTIKTRPNTKEFAEKYDKIFKKDTCLCIGGGKYKYCPLISFKKKCPMFKRKLRSIDNSKKKRYTSKTKRIK